MEYEKRALLGLLESMVSDGTPDEQRRRCWYFVEEIFDAMSAREVVVSLPAAVISRILIEHFDHAGPGQAAS